MAPDDTPLIQPLAGKQRASVQHATHRLNIWEGAVRSSKTICSLLAWLQYTRSGPAGNLAMVGRTERTLKRNVIDPLIDMLGPQRCRYVAGSGEVWILGRRIYTAGANDERATEKIRGLTLAGAYADEVSILPESFWAMLLTRLSVTGAQLLGTTNPDNPNHWLMRDYLCRPALWIRADGTTVADPDSDLDLARFSFQLADNPALSSAYLAALSAEFTGLWRRRFIHGEWVIGDGAIYDMFDPERHQIAELPVDDAGHTDIARWAVAVDYGTTNPFHALLIGVGERRLVVAAEYRHDSRSARRQLTDAEYSAAMRDWLAGIHPAMVDRLDGIWVDPSAASFHAQLHRDGWSGVRGADNSVADGIRDVASLLAADLLVIHDDCTGLLAELPGYVWDPDAARRGEDKPRKVDDHGVDALRYGVRGLRRHWRHWLAPTE